MCLFMFAHNLKAVCVCVCVIGKVPAFTETRAPIDLDTMIRNMNPHRTVRDVFVV
jgi:hypothetical protein